MAAKKITDLIRNTVKAQMFMWEFESFYYEKMYKATFWTDDDAEDTVKRERDAVIGRTTDMHFEDCPLEECRAYAEYLVESSGIEWDAFQELSQWNADWMEIFKKVKGKFSGKGEKMTASEIKKYAAAKKAPKSPATKKASAKKTPAKKASTKKATPKAASAKKASTKKATPKKAVTKSAAVKKELVAKKSAPKGTPAKKSPAKKTPAKKATPKPSLGEHLKAISSRKKAA
jgi:hypothetical protein